MNKEMKEYIKECDCKEIQELWKPKVGDKVIHQKVEFIVIDPAYCCLTICDYEGAKITGIRVEDCIFLPSISWIIEKMGNEFYTLDKVEDKNKFVVWIREKGIDGEKAIDGSTPELACIRALKVILKQKGEK